MADSTQEQDRGWIYWLRNPAFPQMGKLGMTTDLDKRLKDLYTTGVPDPFTMIFARKVTHPYEKERIMHSLLSDKRYSTRREFFMETDERVKMLFSLCEGVWWGQDEVEETQVEVIEPTETPVEPIEPLAQTRKVWSRPALHELLSDGEPVYHTGSCPNERVGHYSRANNAIMWSGVAHTLNQFMKKHYIDERPDRTSAGNAWTECKVRMGTSSGSSLVSMHSLCPSVQSSALNN